MAVKGSFKDISFIELLQIMHLSHKTGRLEVTFENLWAMVIFREGAVWHVEPRGFRGASPIDVLFALIGMTDGNFVFQRLQVLPALERTVNMSTESLILEGAKRLDDQGLIAKEMGEERAGNVLKFKPGAEARVRYMPQNVKRVLQAIDGNRDVNEVVKQSQLDPTQAAQIIKELVAQEVIEVSEASAPAKAPTA